MTGQDLLNVIFVVINGVGWAVMAVVTTVLILDKQSRKMAYAQLQEERKEAQDAMQKLARTQKDMVEFMAKTDSTLKIHNQQLSALTTTAASQGPSYRRT